jgi:Transposase DDE domain group 1
VNATLRKQLAARKRQIKRRLDKANRGDLGKPVLTAANIHYEIAERVQGLSAGGIGALHLLARKIGLIDAIDRRLHLLKVHLPYHESDHVLNFTYNALAGGDCMQDMELRRNDVVFLNALGASRLPDPTTAGDFSRRFQQHHIDTLQEVYDDVRIGVWQKQPAAFFKLAILDVDGTLTATTGACKEGMDIAYEGTWGYHALIVSLANTREVMRVRNRPGNRPSHEGAAADLDQAMATCFRGGFAKVLLRGDTDFSQTQHLDRWDDDGRIEFIFGYDCHANLVNIAGQLPEMAWNKLQRSPPYQARTDPRQRPDNVKDRIVRERGFETLRLQGEEVAEFNYRPTACNRDHRLVVVRKDILRTKGEQVLFSELRYRYLFYITNDWVSEAEQIVYSANDRCHQENLIQQLKTGVPALKAPLDALESNWAYMVMTSLAWNLKAWAALFLPEDGRWQQKYRAEKRWLLGIEFKTFVNALIMIPCQLVRQAHRLVFRILNYSPHHALFFRLVDALHC